MFAHLYNIRSSHISTGEFAMYLIATYTYTNATTLIFFTMQLPRAIHRENLYNMQAMSPLHKKKLNYLCHLEVKLFQL